MLPDPSIDRKAEAARYKLALYVSRKIKSQYRETSNDEVATMTSDIIARMSDSEVYYSLSARGLHWNGQGWGHE